MRYSIGLGMQYSGSVLGKFVSAAAKKRLQLKKSILSRQVHVCFGAGVMRVFVHLPFCTYFSEQLALH